MIRDSFFVIGNNHGYFSEEEEKKDYAAIKNQLILCLMYEGDCISSIELLYIGNNTMEIYTKTSEEYEGNKYNKLLMSTLLIAVTLLVCNERDNITHIKSMATNPISAWYFLKPENKFDDYVVEDLSQEGQDKGIMSLKDLKKEGTITIIIKLTDHNKEKAEVLFNKLTKDEGALICP